MGIHPREEMIPMRRLTICPILAIALAISEAAEVDTPGFARYGIQPGEHAWAPDPRMSHLKPGAISRVERGYFEIDTTVSGIPRATCLFGVPLTRANAPAPTANDIILRFGYMGQRCLGDTDPSRTLDRPAAPSCIILIEPPGDPAGFRWLTALPTVKTIVVFRQRPGFIPVLQQLASFGKASLYVVSAQLDATRDGRIRSIPWTDVALPGEQYEQEQARIIEILGGSIGKR